MKRINIVYIWSQHSVAKLWLTLCEPMDCSIPGFAVLHYLPEFTQMHVYWVSDVIQPSHPLLPFLFLSSVFPSFRVFSNVCSSHQLMVQLQHQSFQWTFRVDFLEDWLVWFSCSPRDSQESSPAPQLKSINSLALSLVYDPTYTFIHDDLKNYSFD